MLCKIFNETWTCKGGYNVIAFGCWWKKKMKSGYILNNFCVYVQNHICKPIKRQKYNIISLVSTKYFNRNQSIILWKNLGPFKKKHYTIFVDKKKNADVSKKHIILTGSHLKQKLP